VQIFGKGNSVIHNNGLPFSREEIHTENQPKSLPKEKSPFDNLIQFVGASDPSFEHAFKVFSDFLPKSTLAQRLLF